MVKFAFPTASEELRQPLLVQDDNDDNTEQDDKDDQEEEIPIWMLCCFWLVLPVALFGMHVFVNTQYRYGEVVHLLVTLGLLLAWRWQGRPEWLMNVLLSLVLNQSNNEVDRDVFVVERYIVICISLFSLVLETVVWCQKRQVTRQRDASSPRQETTLDYCQVV